MTSRATYRRTFAADLLPRIVQAAADEGFVPGTFAGAQWGWVRTQSESVRAAVLVGEATGRHTQDGIDLHASGALYLDDVEHHLRAEGDRPEEAATLIAPLRSWGLAFTRDNRYPLRWSSSPDARVEELVDDLRSFARFASTIRDVSDLGPRQLARSRIRRHVSQGLAPNYSSPAAARAISEICTDVDRG